MTAERKRHDAARADRTRAAPRCGRRWTTSRRTGRFPRISRGTARTHWFSVRRSRVPQNRGIQSRGSGRRWRWRRCILVVLLVGRLAILFLFGRSRTTPLARANRAVILRAIAFLPLEVRAGPRAFDSVLPGKIIAALLRPPKGRPWLLLAAHVSRPVRRLRAARFSNDRRPLLTAK